MTCPALLERVCSSSSGGPFIGPNPPGIDGSRELLLFRRLGQRTITSVLHRRRLAARGGRAGPAVPPHLPQFPPAPPAGFVPAHSQPTMDYLAFITSAIYESICVVAPRGAACGRVRLDPWRTCAVELRASSGADGCRTTANGASTWPIPTARDGAAPRTRPCKFPPHFAFHGALEGRTAAGATPARKFGARPAL